MIDDDDDAPKGFSTGKDYASVRAKLQDHELDLVGGTSFAWCRGEFDMAVDVLIVDEAGQMSLANALAVAGAATSLILFGGPPSIDGRGMLGLAIGGSMSYRDRVVVVANNEAGVNWKENTPRILEYFQASTGTMWTRDNARKISWCTYFAHWVLIKAGVHPLPAVGTAEGLKSVGGSVGRFLKYSPDALKKTNHDGNGVYAFHSASGRYTPRPGDLYYVPIPQNHVGVIVGVDGKHIYSCDGNSGPKPGWDPRFYFSMQGKTVITRMGDGFVYKSGRPKALGNNDFFIEIPDGS